MEGEKELFFFFQYGTDSMLSNIVPRDRVCDLSNGAIFNDLERTLTLFSRSHHSLTLNISQTVTDTVIVTIESE